MKYANENVNENSEWGRRQTIKPIVFVIHESTKKSSRQNKNRTNTVYVQRHSHEIEPISFFTPCFTPFTISIYCRQIFYFYIYYICIPSPHRASRAFQRVRFALRQLGIVPRKHVTADRESPGVSRESSSETVSMERD